MVITGRKDSLDPAARWAITSSQLGPAPNVTAARALLSACGYVPASAVTPEYGACAVAVAQAIWGAQAVPDVAVGQDDFEAEDEVAELRSIYKSIADGHTKRDEHFEFAKPTKSDNADALNARLTSASHRRRPAGNRARDAHDLHRLGHHLPCHSRGGRP
jgi:hypothetical protein